MKRPTFLRYRPENSPPALCAERYQSDEAVAQYCDAHYGPDKFGIPNFTAWLAHPMSGEKSGKRSGTRP